MSKWWHQRSSAINVVVPIGCIKHLILQLELSNTIALILTQTARPLLFY